MVETRKLAAILVSDVVGYSRLAGTDEDRILARLRALRSDLIDPIIAVHNGRVVKRTGDGVIVEFRSVVDAVRCAIEVQNGMVERNAGVPPERRIEFRVGIHLGDVVEESDGDLMGDGVNIAARLEGIAKPGTICLSEDAYRQVRARLDLAVSDLGATQLKNIVEPIRVYSLEVGVAAQAKPATHGEPVALEMPSARLALPDKPSIAVLAFQNMSDDPGQEHFADGIAEDIITGLSRLRWLFVIARNSSFTYRGRNVDVRQVGRELGVGYVLEGSVRKAGNRIRITGQLIEAETGNHLWAEHYDRALDDVFAIQDEITESVIGCIQPELYAAEHARLKRKPPQNLGAWESFVRGMFLYSQHSDAGTKEALGFFDHAVELDHNYAKAHGLRAVCLVWRAFQGWEDRTTAFAEAAEGADRAVACDPLEPWAHVAHGFIADAKRDNSEAVGAFSRAIDASPNFAYAHGLLGAAHALGGRPDQAVECIDRGVRLSPRDTFGDEYQLFYAFAHFQAGRYAAAAAAAQMAVQQRPGHPVPYIIAAASYGLGSETDKAKGSIAQLTNLVPNISAADIEENFPYCQREDRGRLAMGLRTAGLPG